MADRATTTKGETPEERVAAAVSDLRQAMLDAGMAEGEVDAKLWAVYPNERNVVGNFADLQRIGGMAISGEVKGGVQAAVSEPPEAGTDEAMAQIPATGFK